MSEKIEELKIDLGCGPHPMKGFDGVDLIKFDGVKYTFDIGKDKWPFEDESVAEARATHVVEHLTPPERVHFINELYRVLKPNARCLIQTPYWASNRAYGDMSHVWPPVCEWWYYYLSKNWRVEQSPHSDLNKVKEFGGEVTKLLYDCDFSATWGYSLPPYWQNRAPEFQQFGVSHYKDVAEDLVATVVKIKGEVK